MVRREHCETGPNQTHLTDKVEVDGKMVDVISAGGTQQDPETGELRIKTAEVLGPQLWHAGGKYVLGADPSGRDIAVRVLYGGRNSLLIGIGSAIICTPSRRCWRFSPATSAAGATGRSRGSST